MVMAKFVKVGTYIMIDDEPCRVISMQKSKTGRHGSTKTRIEAVGAFDSKKRLLLKPGASELEVPVIEKKSAQVISVSGEIAQLMDLQDYSTFEVSIPEELRGKLDSGTEVVYWKIGNRTALMGLK